MPLADRIITLSGLCEIVLPARTIRLCDGGFINWPAVGQFSPSDSEFGTVESIEAITEAVSDEAPSGKMTMLPPSIVAASTLFQANAQGSAMRFWLAEVSQATGLVVGTPELIFSGLLDTLTVHIGRDRRVVDIEFMSEAERLFWTKEGNVLSQRFHKTAYPSELGFTHATGVPSLVAWGVPGPGRGTTSGGGTSGGGLDRFLSVFGG